MADIQISANLVSASKASTGASMILSFGAAIKRQHPPPELLPLPPVVMLPPRKV